MSLVSAVDLVDILQRNSLLEPQQLGELTTTLQRHFPEARALADELIRRQWLTPYQANLLLQGRGAELLLGSYVLLERLGQGGMGVVYKARHRKMGRLVALKVIRQERLSNEDAVHRFRREIRAAAALSHLNIVLAYDADEVNGRHFFAMEYIEGSDLAKLVKQGGPQPIGQACDWVRQAALGLQHAHERGLVHRDIKPHNLLLTKQGVVKILDMGLARLSPLGEDGEDSTTMTQEGMVMGTPDYMAPEQAEDTHTVDIRGDLYSLGCTFYQLLSGKVPFPGGTLIQKLKKHQFEQPTPIEHLRPDVLSPLQDAPLKTLNCGNTSVSDLTPLKSKKVLTGLYCRDTPIRDFSPLRDIHLKKLFLDHPWRNAAILRSIETLERINGKPAAEFCKKAGNLPKP